MSLELGEGNWHKETLELKVRCRLFSSIYITGERCIKQIIRWSSLTQLTKVFHSEKTCANEFQNSKLKEKK